MSDQHRTGPKEGVYRDAALRVMGEQIEERIDALSRRRRTRARIGVTVLVALTIGSGSIAAYAVTSATHPVAHAPAVVLAGPTQISCSDAQSGAYFTARYRSEAGSTIDQEKLCALVRGRLVADPDGYRVLSPDQAIAAAASFISSAGGRHVRVQEATFSSVGDE